MKARYVGRDKYSEFYDCGRHGTKKTRNLTSAEKMRLVDCLKCQEGTGLDGQQAETASS